MHGYNKSSSTGTEYSNKSRLVVLATSRYHRSGSRDSDQARVHELCRRGWSAGLVAPDAQDLGLRTSQMLVFSRNPYEVGRKRTDDGIEQG